MFSEIAYHLQGYAQQPILWAIADVLFRVAFAFLTNHTSLFAIETLFFWALLCAPSIFLAYAVINGQFGLAFIWPLANAVLWAIAYHNGLCMLFLHTKDHSEKHLHLLLLLAKAIFFLGYALVIAKYWKDKSDQKHEQQPQAAQNHGFDTSIISAEGV